MGDSITEGTIVNIGKAAGDSVQEDEVIAQIETDKVTIDVRAPQAGTLTHIMVKGDDNVEVGQVIAKVDTAGGGSGSAAQEQPAEPRQQEGAAEKGSGEHQQAAKATPAAKIGGQPASASRPQPQDDEHSGGSARVADPGKPEKARLTFPPRHTADGRRISSLPAAEAAAALQELSGSNAGHLESPGELQQEQEQQPVHAAQPSEPQEPEEIASEMEGVRLRRWAVGAPLPMDEDWQPAPGKWALSASEMEMIDLGGADP